MVSKRIARKKANKIWKQELLKSLQENDDVEEQRFNEKYNNVKNSKEAIDAIIIASMTILKHKIKKQ